MANWKKICLWGLSFGVGFAVTLVGLIGLYIWYEKQPKPPKPWNTSAITSTFDHLSTEGADNTPVFYYVIQNNTDFDYSISDTSRFKIMARLEKQDSLSYDEQYLKCNLPIYVPTKQRLKISLHLLYSTPLKLRSNASQEEKNEFRQALTKYIKEQASNLNGFVLFDEENRYQIDFAKGW